MLYVTMLKYHLYQQTSDGLLKYYFHHKIRFLALKIDIFAEMTVLKYTQKYII